MTSQVNATVVRVSAFSVPCGDRGGISHALAYCILECTGPIEAHGIAIVPTCETIASLTIHLFKNF